MIPVERVDGVSARVAALVQQAAATGARPGAA
jgi:hypothetical protein